MDKSKRTVPFSFMLLTGTGTTITNPSPMLMSRAANIAFTARGTLLISVAPHVLEVRVDT